MGPESQARYLPLQKKSLPVKRVVAAGAFTTNALRLVASN
jgi:hypothetical protein